MIKKILEKYQSSVISEQKETSTTSYILVLTYYNNLGFQRHTLSSHTIFQKLKTDQGLKILRKEGKKYLFLGFSQKNMNTSTLTAMHASSQAQRDLGLTCSQVLLLELGRQTKDSETAQVLLQEAQRLINPKRSLTLLGTLAPFHKFLLVSSLSSFEHSTSAAKKGSLWKTLCIEFFFLILVSS